MLMLKGKTNVIDRSSAHIGFDLPEARMILNF